MRIIELHPRNNWESFAKHLHCHCEQSHSQQDVDNSRDCHGAEAPSNDLKSSYANLSRLSATYRKENKKWHTYAF